MERKKVFVVCEMGLNGKILVRQFADFLGERKASAAYKAPHMGRQPPPQILRI